MKVDAARGRLYDSFKNLGHRWSDTEELWGDEVKRDFEEKLWEPLGQMTSEALRAIDRLSQIFMQMRQECEGREGIGGIS